jgi:hypothetical protein
LSTTGIEPSATEQLDTLTRAAQNSSTHRHPQNTGASNQARQQRASMAPGRSI